MPLLPFPIPIHGCLPIAGARLWNDGAANRLLQAAAVETRRRLRQHHATRLLEAADGLECAGATELAAAVESGAAAELALYESEAAAAVLAAVPLRRSLHVAVGELLPALAAIDFDEVAGGEWRRATGGRRAERTACKPSGAGVEAYRLGLGCCVATGGGRLEADAARLLAEAAAGGLQDAGCELGRAFVHSFWDEGRPAARRQADSILGFEWYSNTAEHGHAGAQRGLGECYGSGIGVVQDKRSAFGWLMLAAEQGDADAECAVGVCLREGQGVAADNRLAFEWFSKAAERGGCAEARFQLGLCYSGGCSTSHTPSHTPSHILPFLQRTVWIMQKLMLQ